MRPWLLVLAILAAAFVALSARLFAFPSEHVPQRADAVVVLAGNWERRLPVGERLVDQGVAPILVLSEEPDDDWPRGRCRRARVTCFQAVPYSTTGEAAAIASLVGRRGWDDVVVVTSDYHVTRARLLVRRCVAGRVDATGADEPILDWLHGTVWEWPKLVYALVARRGC